VSIVFYCEHCDEKITVADGSEGQEMQCPCCEAGILIPTGGPAPAKAAQAAPPGDMRTVSGTPTTRCIFLFVGWAAIVVGLAIVLGGIIVIAHTPNQAYTTGSHLLLYSWMITLLPGIATFLAGVLVLGVLAWIKSVASPPQKNE
jgi:hypothetical protein